MVKAPPKYYAVAIGKKTGIYTSWADCSAQVTRFSGAIFKGHQTLSEAERWMGANGAENHAQLAGERPSFLLAAARDHRPLGAQPLTDDNAPTPSQDFRSSWRPYSKLDDDAKLKLKKEFPLTQEKHVIKEYHKRRTRAMQREIERHLFDLDPANRLAGYQALCRAIRIEPSDTIEECRADVRGTLVNIMDLIAALETQTPVKVWRHDEWEEFRRYTKQAENCFHCGEAKKSRILSCFLQYLDGVEPQKSGNPRPLKSGCHVDLPKLEPASSASDSEDSSDSDSSESSSSESVPEADVPVKIKEGSPSYRPDGGAMVGIKRETERPVSIKAEPPWATPAITRSTINPQQSTQSPAKVKFEDAWPTASAFMATKFGSPSTRSPLPSTANTTNSKKRSAQHLDDFIPMPAIAPKRPKLSPTAVIPDSDASSGGETDWGWDSDFETDGDIFKDALAASQKPPQQQVGQHKDAPIVIEDSPPPEAIRRPPLGARGQGEAARVVVKEEERVGRRGEGLGLGKLAGRKQRPSLGAAAAAIAAGGDAGGLLDPLAPEAPVQVVSRRILTILDHRRIGGGRQYEIQWISKHKEWIAAEKLAEIMGIFGKTEELEEEITRFHEGKSDQSVCLCLEWSEAARLDEQAHICSCVPPSHV